MPHTGTCHLQPMYLEHSLQHFAAGRRQVMFNRAMNLQSSIVRSGKTAGFRQLFSNVTFSLDNSKVLIWVSWNPLATLFHYYFVYVLNIYGLNPNKNLNWVFLAFSGTKRKQNYVKTSLNNDDLHLFCNLNFVCYTWCFRKKLAL